jgi:hypothetical protein
MNSLPVAATLTDLQALFIKPQLTLNRRIRIGCSDTGLKTGNSILA